MLRRLADAGLAEDRAAAVAAGLLTPGEAALIREADDAVRAAIRVDDFAATRPPDPATASGRRRAAAASTPEEDGALVKGEEEATHEPHG